MALLKKVFCAIWRLSLLVVLWVSSSAAIDLSEEQVKAAYLYNFAKFAEWPADALPLAAEMRLCLVGSGRMNAAISALQGRKIGEHWLSVVTIEPGDPELQHCHVLFMAQSERSHFLVTLKALASKPILTVSDIEDFSEKGGGIGLVYHDGTVKFEVNLDAIRAANLRLPGQLLNIATHVYGN